MEWLWAVVASYLVVGLAFCVYAMSITGRGKSLIVAWPVIVYRMIFGR